jgi:Domain of unknown function (DUF3854)
MQEHEEEPGAEFGLGLLPQHADYLRARGVDPAIARERRYRSADTKAGVKRLGFSDSQSNVPALVIPRYGVVSDEVVGYQIRPDDPRSIDGRVVKFETPRGSSLGLDVPPRVRPHLGNPKIPLGFTEGAVKADAAVSHDLMCVALFGVYGWRTKNDLGGTSVLPELEHCSLKGRLVYLIFDSDLMLKLQVHNALRRFYDVLKHRGANVGVVLLPPGEHAEKTGLDDYFARGGTVEELLARHVVEGVPEPPRLPTTKPAGKGQAPTCSELSEGDGTATIDEVVQAFQDRLELSDTDPLLAMLGAKAALEQPGDPVWLLIIDGSSGGKTEQLMPLDALPDVHLCALLTEASLLSGTSQRERAENATGGVLCQVGDHGVILMKDFTSVLSMQRDTRAQTLAALREVHDGSWSRPVGTDGGQVLHWRGKCAVIAGCTEAWDTAHAVVSTMGDRFLCVRPRHDSRKKFAKRASRGAGDEIEIRAALAQTVRSLFNTPLSSPSPVPDEDLLVDVADLVTLARSPIQRDRRGELVLVLAPEMPGRFVKALTGLWNGLTALGCDRETAWRVVMRTAFDSMPRIRRRVLEVLADAGGWKETGPVRNEARLPLSTTKRALEDLHAHGVLEREESEGGPKGDRWTLTDDYLEVWNRGHAPLSDISEQVDETPSETVADPVTPSESTRAGDAPACSNEPTPVPLAEARERGYLHRGERLDDAARDTLTTSIQVRATDARDRFLATDPRRHGFQLPEAATAKSWPQRWEEARARAAGDAAHFEAPSERTDGSCEQCPATESLVLTVHGRLCLVCAERVAHDPSSNLYYPRRKKELSS